MKFAAALSLGIAPVALAKAVHNVYPVRRDPSRGKPESKSAARGIGSGVGVGINSGFNAAEAIAIEAAVLEAQTGLLVGSLNEIIVLWVNPGGGAVTTSIIGSAPPAATGVGVGAGQQVGAPPPVGVAGQGAGVATTTPGVGVGTGTGTVGQAGTATHTVTVGGPKGVIFEPDQIAANVGDTVIFQFLSQNHTATQSAFLTPCVPLAGGMDTNFQANQNNTVNPPPQVAMQVMASTPLWFHCRQNGHCGKGMTFAINPTKAKTQAMFQAMAIAQNGTGTGSAITGNGGGSTGTGTGTGTGAGSSSVGVSSETGLTATLGSLPTEATGTTGAAGASASGVVTGTGSVNPDGSCSCAVVCSGTGSFPAVQAQGVGAFGGVPGALPSSMVAVK